LRDVCEREARALLARAQRLAPAARDDGASVAQVVRAVVGIQAQDLGAASLGVRARLAGSTASGVTRARVQERAVVRIWCMRATLHLVAAEDVRWLLALLGPVALARLRGRQAGLGVDDAAAAAAVAALAEHGPLDRHALLAAVRARGIALAEDPQAAVHLAAGAALRGQVCGAGDGTYARLDDWLGPAEAPPPARDVLLAELARRHRAAHPPTGPEDLARWSGLPLGEARRAHATIAGEPAPEVAPAEPLAPRLLPAFDGLLLGHTDRSLVLAPEHERAVHPGGGILRPTILHEGRVAGTWRLRGGTPLLAPFAAPLDLDDEIADVQRHRGS